MADAVVDYTELLYTPPKINGSLDLDLTWLRMFLLANQGWQGLNTEALVFSRHAVDGIKISSAGDASGLAKLIDSASGAAESPPEMILISYPQTWSLNRKMFGVVASKYELDSELVQRHLYHEGSWKDRLAPSTKPVAPRSVRSVILQSEGLFEFGRPSRDVLLSVWPVKAKGSGLAESQPNGAETMLVLCRGLHFLANLKKLLARPWPKPHPMNRERFMWLIEHMDSAAIESANNSVLEYTLPFVKMLALDFAREIDLRQARDHQFNQSAVDDSSVEAYASKMTRFRDSAIDARDGLLAFPKSRARDVHLADYDRILGLIERMSQDFMTRMNHKVAWMSVSESKHSIEEAKAVRQLTQLAFFFIPLTFVASCFGMNLDLLGSGSGKLWVFITTSVCLTIGVVVLWRCYPWLSWSIKRCRDAVSGLFRSGETSLG
ncbi:hypothetical protein QBC42DRAFT_276978 [Cladorrhinum samala]|uniref:Uncharacterized protein n=1 Tax=Cladorrhinum samala TaxID=585594 RepID=A0AAV9HED8_9PEZI|nr:hypothetical protein QBC42DRAFT_276978 [Cladorrhinum samala]